MSNASDESVTVADTVVPIGSGKPKSQRTKKANVSNAKNLKIKPLPTAKFKSKDRNVVKFASLANLLSDATRVAILLNLSGGALNVTEIVKRLDMTQPAVSHHLALMRAAATIEGDRQGKSIYYSLTAKGTMLVKFAKAAMEDQ